MRVRFFYALAFAALVSLVALGCGSNSQPYAFGGNPTGTGSGTGTTNFPLAGGAATQTPR